MGIKTFRIRFSVQAAALLLALFLCNLNGATSAHAAELRGGFGPSMDIRETYDIAAVKKRLSPLNRSPKLIEEIDKISLSLDKSAPKMFRVELDLFKLDALAKSEDLSAAGEFAAKIYANHPRDTFASDVEYGDTMYQIVESLAKTDNLDISYDIIRTLRVDLYHNTNKYLSFILEKSLIEVHIETSDYKRALSLALSAINNPEFADLEEVRDWRLSAVNEIAYLYNKLGDGKNALVYLAEAAQIIETKDPSLKSVKKARALNFANRGRAYLHLKDFAKARDMGKKVQAANKDLNQTYLTAVSLRLIGCADFKNGAYAQAAKHLKAGITLARKDNNISLKRTLYYEYAMVLGKLGQHQEAAFWFKELYALETHRQETISATRSRLSALELSAFKDHQEMVHLHHELEHSHSINKLMLLAILSLLSAGLILIWLLRNLRRNQKKLLQSEMEAQVANHAKSDFLANMSHEIRTPMNGVLGMAQVLERTPLSEQQNLYLDIIKQSGNTLLDLINDILDFSKIEADKLTLNYSPCNLDEILHDIIRLLTPNAQDQNVAIYYDYDPSFPNYFALDGKRIRQIIMNLIGNAVKFTSDGHVTVKVRGRVENDVAQISISVADTGIGIKPDQVDTIFEKFTQATNSSERFHGGTGLGLAISHRLTKAMKGDLSVTSKIGEGSIFTLTLPAEIVSAVARPQTTRAEMPTSQAA